jgi:hypothetical protein
MLDLDAMKQHWTQYDRKLDESIRLNRELLSATNLNQARSALQRMTAFLGLEAAVWFVCVMALGSFIYEQIATLRWALLAVALGLYAIGMLAATIRLMVTAGQIDYDRPITAIQKQLTRLRVLRIRTTQWGLLAGAVVWAPVALGVSRVFLGISGYNAPWLLANVAFGLALIPLAWWLSKNFGERMGRSPFMQQLMNDIAGRNLSAAVSFLARLSEFEDERP